MCSSYQTVETLHETNSVGFVLLTNSACFPPTLSTLGLLVSEEELKERELWVFLRFPFLLCYHLLLRWLARKVTRVRKDRIEPLGPPCVLECRSAKASSVGKRGLSDLPASSLSRRCRTRALSVAELPTHKTPRILCLRGITDTACGAAERSSGCWHGTYHRCSQEGSIVPSHLPTGSKMKLLQI